MRSPRSVLGGALGVLLGLHALRTFLTGLVWMVGESLPYYVMGALAIALVSLGLLAGTMMQRMGRIRTERVTALTVAGLYLAALVTPLPPFRLGLSASTVVVWIWWFSTYMCGRHSLPASLVGGLSLDVTIRVILHGIDLPLTGSFWGVAALGAAFLWAADAAPVLDGSPPSWSIVALAPWLFVQMEVLTNLARIRMLAGLGPTGALLLAQLSLATGLIAMASPMPGGVRAALGVTGGLILLHPTGWLWLPAAQVGAGAALAGSLRSGKTELWPPLIFLILVSIFYLFYTQNTWPLLPPLAVIALALTSLFMRSGAALRISRRMVMLPLVLTAIALLVSPFASHREIASFSPQRGAIRLMTYNIHQGLDYQSLPSPEQIARVIEVQEPDVVALQEVNRGWTISGAADFVTWLQWRLPAYHLIYGPMIGDLWGTAILSRLPVRADGAAHFVSDFPHATGFSWAILAHPACDLLMINTHLSTGVTMGPERVRQMKQVLSFWGGRPCTIISGDLNSAPQSDVVSLLTGAGFIDWLGQLVAPRPATWPANAPVESIDYIASTDDWRAISARAIPALASDHRPVVVELVRAKR